MTSPARGVLRSAALAFLALGMSGLVLHAAHASAAAAPGGDPVIADWLYCSLFGLAALSCLLRAIREHERGGNALPWGTAAAGVVLWGAAEVSFRLIEPDPTVSYPRLTQGLLLLSFALATVTLVLLARERIEGFHKGLALDGLIGGLAISSVAASLLFPVSSGGTIAQTGPPAVFLLADLAILALVIVSIALTGWRPGRCWALISAGIVVNTVGNIALVQATNAGSFERGSPVDTLYAASALLLGFATVYPIRPMVTRRADDARRVVAPLLSAVIALALLCVAAFTEVAPVAVLLAAATIALVVLRTALAFRDNQQLLEARQRDALSDNLTGLGNRRKLMGDLDRAMEEVRAGSLRSLVLFDLDGFKRYNDTFGHPAGDTLLARLGANLSLTVSAHGDAYRVGGDEFCAIVWTDDLKEEAIIAGACEALSDSGSGFSVRPSFGAVALGREASNSSEALHIADQRMYAHKQGRPGSVTREARAVLLSILSEREPTLDEHLHAVARLAQLVSEELGLDNEERDVVVRAAELHDIGKMAMPDSILRKPGPLTDTEWEVMRRHTVVGERILGSVPALGPVATVVRSTHERIDGEGYPDGLAGED
ncbi:MAG: diguanylate cyclase domain-containing protein, partial [Solirubrobacterales bacterium]